MVKNCDLGLENAALGHFQDLGHSFSPYGPPSQQITYIYISPDYVVTRIISKFIIFTVTIKK